MPVAGAGGFLSNLYFPGLDERLATHITPNPRPLAQEGQGGAGPGTVDQLGNPSPGAPAPASGPPMAPAAVTQPDPINNAYAMDLIKASRRDAMGQGINQGLGEIAAGFGTAQQQASKQQALAAGRGGVGGSSADLATIQACRTRPSGQRTRPLHGQRRDLRQNSWVASRSSDRKSEMEALRR